MQAKVLSAPILLKINGLSHVPSFKNTKSIYRKKNGQPFIATKRERKEWMERAIRSIEYQLSSAFQTTVGATATAHNLPSWIASCVPLDDSHQWMAELHVKAVMVPRDEEGADILIEQI